MTLSIDNLSFGYNGRPILKNLSLTVQPGETVCLIGRSGSGKTTLFRLIMELLLQQQGTITRPSGQISYMMQDDLLLPWRTAWENLLLPFELGEGVTTTQEDLARELLSAMGLFQARTTHPHKLSGGMRQRLSLARALLLKRPLLLLDEPFGALDVVTREELYQTVKAFHRGSIFLITHDFRDAFHLADRILLLDKGCIRGNWSLSEKAHQEIERELRSALSSSQAI